jgi:hypothetical protein
MNKQPFYHRMVVLFTTTDGKLVVAEDRVRKAIETLPAFVAGSYVTDEHD